MRRRGLTQAEIGRLLGVQRQGVNRALLTIDNKVTRALIEVAQLNRLDIRSVDPVNGILEAYSKAHRVPSIVSFTEANGVQIWYIYEGKCETCDRVEGCRAMLQAEARERGVELAEGDRALPPTLLAKKVFSRYSKVI